MKFDFTVTKLKKLLPRNQDTQKLHEALSRILPKYGIDTVERVSMFLGQCALESSEFTYLTENLNYSTQGLLKTFPKYFNRVTARVYANKPEKIANRVYANRMGNGDEKSGDGWKYRGAGFIQLTGKYNYMKWAESMGMSIDQAVNHVKTLDGAIEAACWFWTTRKMNDDADRMDIHTTTKKINGGFHGLNQRIFYVRKAYTLFTSQQDELPEILKKGDRGEAVFDLQTKLTRLGFVVAIDGNFGIGTENAVKQFQRSTGLKEDGIVGPKTRMLMYV